MKIRRYFHINLIATLAIVALGAVACQKEERGDDTVNLVAHGDIKPNGGKAYVNTGNYICWIDGDKVKINNSTCPLSVSGANESVATATISGVPAVDDDGFYTAAYPADNVTAISSGSNVTLSIPAVQTYKTTSSPAGTVQVVEMPMVGQCGGRDESIQFRNVASLIKVNVTGAQKVYKIEVAAAAGVKLNGSASVNPATGTFSSTLDGSNTVTLDCSTYPAATEDFYLVVAPFTSESVTVTVWTAGVDNKKYIGTKTSSGPKTIQRNEMGAVTVSVTDDGSGPFFWGGNGTTEASPWLITYEGDLTTIRTNVNAGTSYSGYYFLQTTDIDASATAWTAIGTSSNKFSGTYDGGSHSVALDFKPTADYYGLFGYTNGATIKNITVTGAYNAGSTPSAYVGGVCGYANMGTTISKCTNNIEGITGTTNLGGIVGAFGGGSRSTIEKCLNTQTITSTTENACLGGIIGVVKVSSTSLSIEKCKNMANITGGQNSYTGGIVGNITRGTTTIRDCGVECTAVTNLSGYAGGLVGNIDYNNLIVNAYNCYINADISAQSGYAGGLVGRVYSHSSTGSTFNATNCCYTGTLKSNNSYPVGYKDTYSAINSSNCYAGTRFPSSTSTITGSGYASAYFDASGSAIKGTFYESQTTVGGALRKYVEDYPSESYLKWTSEAIPTLDWTGVLLE